MSHDTAPSDIRRYRRAGGHRPAGCCGGDAMSGGGLIIDRRPGRVLAGSIAYAVRIDVVHYRVQDRHSDVTAVMAVPADDEPQIGDSIWWGAEPVIYWGPNDSKRLTKVGYSV